ncbi:RNA polymerase II subunit A C-terminal domain phosphatase [Aphelenchoides besseyi]|nr:RNA polymerase II subunit A C-terminal domain phosphatase [Aphelenchoides besseyi]
MDEEVEIRFEEQQVDCSFVRFTTQDGRFINEKNPLLEYSCGGKKRKFKCPLKGMLRLNNETLSPGSTLKSGDVVAWITGPCTHAQIMIDMCTVCGTSLADTKFVEDKRNGLAPYVSTVHNAPGLMTNLNIATELDKKKKETLLENRRLILLIDLDQTLIHTTNKTPRPEEMRKNVQGFRLGQSIYYTRIRPHTQTFLENLHQIFECHVVTYGERAYAERITMMLDPNGRYFNSRILTRNELISMSKKTVNLSALFPSGTEIVLMIDDRPDVWENSDSLVWVKPYKFFTEVDDINAPKEAEKPGVTDKNGNADVEAVRDAEKEAETNGVSNGDQIETEVLTETEDSDGDDVLSNIERVLKDIHNRYFAAYDQEKKIRDVKSIAADVRNEILRGEVLVLSGIVQLQQNMKEHPFYKLCIRLGAEVVDEVDSRVTVLIAAKPHTEKYRAARKHKIPVVKPDWVEDCLAYWKKVDKKPFILYVPTDYDQQIGSELANMPTIAKGELKFMEDEVAAELGNLSSSDEEDDDEIPTKRNKLS